AARGRKKGRVVRVERAHGGTSGFVRMCSNPTPQGTANCFGRPPAVGEIGTVIDDSGVRATIEIQKGDAQNRSCGNASSWNITTTTVTGDTSQIGYQAQILLDDRRAAAAKLVTGGQLPPTARPGETLMASFDEDGDADTDLMVSWYPCDQVGTAQGYGQATAYCMVYYAKTGGTLDPLRVDIVKNCY